ncbi:hypothetical protein FACS1894167_11200 [Synergistales bacterium]|nr:hypothetical protein FACS1894167_11200 [Synergistales bacterium]
MRKIQIAWRVGALFVEYGCQEYAKGEFIMKAIELADSILNCLSTSPKLREQFADRISHLKTQRNGWWRQTIRVGVIGVTSSGKSTLVNAVIGRKLLSRALKPTSGQLVNCVKGSESFAEISFCDGTPSIRLSGRSLCEDEIKKYSDENHNRRNAKKVDQIHISTSEFDLGERVELVDSPGLDAYNLEEHEKLALEIMLPTVDMCVFVSTLKANSDEKARMVLNAIVAYKKPLIIVQNMLDSVVPSADGKKTKDDVAKEYQKRLERIINNSNVADKSSIRIVQMSAIYAQEERCDGKRSKVNSHYTEFKDAIKAALEICSPHIEHNRVDLLCKDISVLISNAEKLLSGINVDDDLTAKFPYAGLNDGISTYFNNTKSKMQSCADDLKRLHNNSFSSSYSYIDNIKSQVQSVEKKIRETISDFNSYVAEKANQLNIPERDIRVDVRVDSVSVPTTSYTVKDNSHWENDDKWYSCAARVVGEIFGKKEWGREWVEDRVTVIDEETTIKEIRDYIQRAANAYSGTIDSWGSSVERAIGKLESAVDSKRSEWAELKQQKASDAEIRNAIDGIKALIDRQRQEQVKSQPVKAKAAQNDTSIAKPAIHEIELNEIQRGIRELASTVIHNAFDAVIKDAMEYVDAPDDIAVLGWDEECIRNFVYRFFGIRLSENMSANTRRISVINNPDAQSTLSVTKESRSIFVLVNVHQHGSAKNQVSKLELRKALQDNSNLKNGKNCKVFFVMQDFEGIINSATVKETILLMSEYYQEFVPDGFRGVSLINADNPLYSMALVQVQETPCNSQMSELDLIRHIKNELHYLLGEDRAMASNVIGDIVRKGAVNGKV